MQTFTISRVCIHDCWTNLWLDMSCSTLSLLLSLYFNMLCYITGVDTNISFYSIYPNCHVEMGKLTNAHTQKHANTYTHIYTHLHTHESIVHFSYTFQYFYRFIFSLFVKLFSNRVELSIFDIPIASSWNFW